MKTETLITLRSELESELLLTEKRILVAHSGVGKTLKVLTQLLNPSLVYRDLASQMAEKKGELGLRQRSLTAALCECPDELAEILRNGNAPIEEAKFEFRSIEIKNTVQVVEVASQHLFRIGLLSLLKKLCIVSDLLLRVKRSSKDFW